MELEKLSAMIETADALAHLMLLDLHFAILSPPHRPAFSTHLPTIAESAEKEKKKGKTSHKCSGILKGEENK